MKLNCKRLYLMNSEPDEDLHAAVRTIQEAQEDQDALVRLSSLRNLPLCLISQLIKHLPKVSGVLG